MANSRKPGPANPPMDWCRIPALTPGPLGLFDQGDPNLTTLLGDTPGPLGMNDWNDPTIGCFQNALAKLSLETHGDFMGMGVDSALWPIAPPVNRIAIRAHESSVSSRATANGAGGPPAAGAVTDFTTVANTRGGYPSQGITEYQGGKVAYTTSFNSATGYWEQSTADGFLINAISWAPHDARPPRPRSAMSFSMTLQSDSLYTAGRSFFGDAYRVAIHEVLDSHNTWAIRTGYGLAALVVAIPGLMNDLSRDLYNSPNDLYVGGKKMSAGLTNRDPYGFSDGLMRFGTGLLSAAGGAAIVEKGIVSNRMTTEYAVSNPAARATYVEAETTFKKAEPGRPPSDVSIPTASAMQDAESMVREPSSAAKFGNAASNDYRATFFEANPGFEGQVKVHHAVEQQVLNKFPGVVSETEMHSLENLRGIPSEINNTTHLSDIRVEWNRFYKPFIVEGTAPTKAQLLQKATEIDLRYGSTFNPPLEGGK